MDCVNSKAKFLIDRVIKIPNMNKSYWFIGKEYQYLFKNEFIIYSSLMILEVCLSESCILPGVQLPVKSLKSYARISGKNLLCL